MQVRLDPHCQRRMRERGISPEDMANAWLNSEKDQPSQDHPGARVRTATLADGSRVTVVAHQSEHELYFITVW